MTEKEYEIHQRYDALLKENKELKGKIYCLKQKLKKWKERLKAVEAEIVWHNS